MSNTDTTSTPTSKSTVAEKPKAAPAKTLATARKPAKKVAATAPSPTPKKPAARTVAKPTKTVVAATPNPVKAGSPAKVKHKLVRDSFTMPRGDFGLINTLKERALTFRRPTKKSELLRAGLHALSALPDAKLKLVLDGLVPLKAGRPKKDE